MILLLHRALRNAGDYLIFERARKLFERYRSGAEYLVGRADIELESQFEEATLRRLSAIVICGGPGLQDHLHPKVYPLTSGRVAAPIIFLATGGYLVPGSEAHVRTHRFDAETVRFLRQTAADAPFFGVRDAVTLRMLQAVDVPRLVLNGDPAWYDLDTIDAPLALPVRLRRVAFTPPAHIAYQAQATDLLVRLVDRLGADGVVVVFHRGVQHAYAQLALSLGCRVADISGSAAGFVVYEECDAHVGYRLHAHLYCLSRGLVSYLVAEDSRGRGALETLGALGVIGHGSGSGAGPLSRLAWRVAARYLEPTRHGGGRVGRLASAAFRLPAVSDQLLGMIEDDQSRRFARHEAARAVIRQTLPTMVASVSSVP